MSKTKGNVTLPSEKDFFKETKELMERLGADAIRDSDGTKLSDDIKNLDAKIYSTYFVARGQNEWAKENLDQSTNLYLMSSYNVATETTLEIDFMKGYFAEQVQPDYDHDPKKWWEVINRTTGKIVNINKWSVDSEKGLVVIEDAHKFHEYTVSFMVRSIWDMTQMYNHITNDWGDSVEHDLPFDARKPKAQQHMIDYIENWLEENDDTDVVRFTTFFYHFTLVFNEEGKEKFVDWFGYSASVSPEALDAFEEERGYRLRPEHIIDQGYYNSPFRVPTKEYLDFIDFQQQFVSQMAKKLVDRVHDKDKEAMMFLGDNWMGIEPYGEYFKDIGLDAVVGSVGGGATLRLISDIPHLKYTEGRFLPYFFPDTFYEGNDPVIEAKDNWISSRRAIMRKPVDRIGYGGYPSLAYKFPDFIDYIEHVTDEFREIYSNINGVKPYSGLKVAILNSWGKIRSWQTHMVAHALWYKQIYSYLGIIESLSGMAVDVEFISFDDIKNNGVSKDIDVIINAGDAETAYSGGDEWLDKDLVTTLRKWIYNGGGFIGVGEPSAVHHQGRFFQMADALGVDKELGFTLSTNKYFTKEVDSHFILEGIKEDIDFGEGMKNIYSLSENTEIIKYSNGEVNLAANDYGKGRAVYMAGLPYNHTNTRLLYRMMYYVANKESDINTWFSSNVSVEVNVYPEINKYAIVNNSDQKQTTTIYDGNQSETQVELRPGEIRWENI